ncbi:Glucosamine-6-phosphate deaminase [[Actinomadura] parvosata subsp. kistnae]|uniref:6-phosphogluconolactonase n=1 Tax=[Actinomadura] parvosata TaxID=1955412 RepID=UPI000D2814AB|nr:6-phosphogluconolactonase [Nonomuraea sp. ATCC 55076]SPL87885.1 Glucosamine-6-phosphate deaminase [Actinomadura parvosata subsp. kistnae]
MRVRPTVFPDPEALGHVLAARIATEIADAARDGRPYVLGCPGGRSARSTYAALAREVAARRLSLGHVVIVMMDEYVVRAPETGRFRRIDPDLPHSCVRFGRAEIVEPLNAAAGPGRGITPDRFWVPDPADPGEYDRRIAGIGGVDLFILASGAGDGHIAFNPAGTPADARTRVVALAERTRRDNLATFPTFGGLEEVPGHGVTVGVATIRDLSKQVVMVVHGADKAATARRLAAADRYDPGWPATVLSDCAAPSLLADEATGLTAGHPAPDRP